MNEPYQPGFFSPDTPDRVLVQHALQGNQDAFACLVGRYHTVLVGYISSWSPDPSLVPDIEQDTLLRLYLSLPILRTDQPLRAWLLRVAYYACMSECRRRKPLLFSQVECVSAEEPFWLAAVPDPDPLPEEVLEQQERHCLVQRAIEALPRGQRAAIRLKYLEHLSYRDIARRLHIPEGTAKTHVARAKPMLRHLLTGEISHVND
jgi:RNA polymerase sigma factor (sigma-70 family)